MLSFKKVNDSSRHIATIINREANKSEELIFFSELGRFESINNDEFERKVKKYKAENVENDDTLILKNEYKFELVPSNSVSNLERETIAIFGKSGSGKSFTIKKYIKNYLKIFPKNKVYYISLNDIFKDESFKDIIGNKNLKQIFWGCQYKQYIG